MEQGDEKDGVAPLLFKSPICRLPQNRTLAEIQLSAQTHSFNRKPQTQRHSHSWRNCLKIVMPKQPPTSKKGEKCWHLPMFGVYHPKKPTKIQVVCNSSAKHIGISFNDVQIIGPDLNNTLIQSPHLFLQSHYSRHWTDVSLLPGEKGTQEFFWGESYPRAVNYSLINPDSEKSSHSLPHFPETSNLDPCGSRSSPPGYHWLGLWPTLYTSPIPFTRPKPPQMVGVLGGTIVKRHVLLRNSHMLRILSSELFKMSMPRSSCI